MRNLHAILAIVAAFATPASAQLPGYGNDRVLVLPFDSVGPDAGVYWLREASAVLLGDSLEDLGVNVLTRAERQHAFRQLSLPTVSSLTHATIIRVGQLVGATDVVMGSLDVSRSVVTVRVRNIRLDAGRLEPETVENGALDDLYAIFDRVARRLVPSAAGAGGETRPPLDAFANYIKGLLAENHDARIKYLETALGNAPQYDRAHLALWDIHTERGEHDLALAAARAVPERSRDFRRSRFLAGLSQLELKRYDEALVTWKALADADPAAALFNNIGVALMRRGWTALTGRPSYYFTKACEAEPEEPDYFFNLAYAYWFERNAEETVRVLREAVRRNPADGDAHFVLAVALKTTGATLEAGREMELALQLSSKYIEWNSKEPSVSQAVPRGLERVRTDLGQRGSGRLDFAISQATQREQRELAAFHLASGRRLFEQGRDTEAVAELRRSLYLSPYQAEPHILLGRVYLRTGRIREAVETLKISLWSEETAAAHAVLGLAFLQSGDTAAAREEAQRALALDPDSAETRSLIGRLEQSQSR